LPTLQHNEATRARVEGWKEELLANRSVAHWLDRLWQRGRTAIIAAARNPTRCSPAAWARCCARRAPPLKATPASARGQPVRPPRRAGMAASYGGIDRQPGQRHHRGWDARTVTERLESAVGRDLQYIRINGHSGRRPGRLILHFLDTL
jgi:hypothetical protein